MGIEPTDHDSRRSPAGFEDQARHQTGSTSHQQNYTTPFKLFPWPDITLLVILTGSWE